MSWFTKQDTSTPPNRSKRQQCWDKRDAYFKCLDKINVENALDANNEKLIQKSCSSEDKQFNDNCAKSWVKYFKEQRYYAFKKERFIKEVEAKNAIQQAKLAEKKEGKQ